MIVAFSFVSNSYANGTNWWHNLSQYSRNQLIVDKGAKYLGQNLGNPNGQCKYWIQNFVVNLASGNHVYLPSNALYPNDYYWNNDPNGHAVGMSIPLQYAEVGWIVQFRIAGKYYPHTAIIAGKSPDGVTFLDSNWLLDTTVRTHFVSYTDFYNMLESPGSFTIYYIL